MKQKNGTAVIAPEGFTSVDGRSHPVDPGTGHLLKYLNVPIYYCELRGLYLTATKTCTDIRYGKVPCTIRKLYEPSDLNKMSELELESKLNNLFNMDEYKFAKKLNIKWKNNNRMCKNLDDLCYRCPKCHKVFSIKNVDNKLVCDNGFHYIGTKDGEKFEFTIDYKRIHTVLGSTDFSYFFVYKNGEYFDIFPQEHRSGYHVMLMIE